MAGFIEKVDQDKFVEIFKAWEYNSFSDDALRKIYDIETEINCDQDFITIDKVVINGSYNEYKNWKEFLDDYSHYCIENEIIGVQTLEKFQTVYYLENGAFLVVPF
jgi:hypothetical protein